MTFNSSLGPVETSLCFCNVFAPPDFEIDVGMRFLVDCGVVRTLKPLDWDGEDADLTIFLALIFAAACAIKSSFDGSVTGWIMIILCCFTDLRENSRFGFMLTDI